LIQMINAGSPAALVFASAVSAMLIAPTAFSQAPSEAQRSAIRSACRADYEAHCASIAGRGGVLAVLAKKPDEPLATLSKRCARARSSDRVEGGAGSRDCTREDRGSACGPTRGAKTDRHCGKPGGKAADQRANRRDSQRLSRRLSEGLRWGADRGRRCAAMPGEKQVESLSKLSDGHCRRPLGDASSSYSRRAYRRSH
jgi:hypothetical protein